MITKKALNDGTVKVTFSLEDDRPVSVVGDFNGWDPMAHPMVRRSSGKRSVAVTFPEGSRLCFRYLADGGEFFDDPSVDEIERDGLGSTHSIVTADLTDA